MAISAMTAEAKIRDHFQAINNPAVYNLTLLLRSRLSYSLLLYFILIILLLVCSMCLLLHLFKPNEALDRNPSEP